MWIRGMLVEVTPDASPTIESALRSMATNQQARPIELLIDAHREPTGTTGLALRPLVTATESMPDGTPESRALAIWGLIVAEVERIGPSDDSRERNVLRAAFRLAQRPEIRGPWKPTLGDRFKQLKVLPAFRSPQTIAPMHQAWNKVLASRLLPALNDRLTALEQDRTDWQKHLENGRRAEAVVTDTSWTADVASRRPSPNAQPLFLDLFITTVFMKGRSVYRRITERLVSARADGVDGYLAKALVGSSNDPHLLPVRALWGCTVDSPPTSPPLTRLRFPSPLRFGMKHFFTSETIVDDTDEEREWVNVEIDHHGIAAGKRQSDLLPTSGLTIRIRFDEVPETVWWYAEETENGRRVRPPSDDPRYLDCSTGMVEHTFEQPCYPRESYGLSIAWKDVR